ncbi:FAD-dependent oxidoreductase (homolog to geranylgeranyl reductase) [Natronomonas pharaonis DSM 2160]|uniref:FAD-dependent oxidoreductase (Homolog to geranylgeranyl reductase) n=1 Tax=Natronomonas pharaonis (strain ATCC 35678 / DSM 2160 / CIP 103997 / JCM 8858 / NBRC 14720 / NCIMB 2260 / Gabara) TaxID=348780 RepID=A0A1U7EYN3_NATPD|nr:geranylgeranyl reductase family protein [Natronomonas pharaonis]CAI50373.1 FAD-dependent oxidoreductase (homolog to geranylgeranyl reductase) [Natronomonas pharaonis DSM 2160]
MPPESYDIVVVGGGTAGCFAAATAAQNGLDVVLLERKSEEEGGHIACGDAIKGTSTFPDVIDREYLREESFTNEGITLARFENPKGENLDIGFRGNNGAIVDRKRYGEVLLEEADRVGAELHYNTVVQDVIQENGVVRGVQAMRNGDALEYEADVVIDAAGALSLLQDKADLGDATFDTKVNYQQFCSAYREVIEVPEPVEWDDAIVFKPTAELGYLWYFPRTPTEINVGLGFQMNKEPMELVDELKADIRNRPEFEGATVKNKLGAALPTRRPYDSATAPGYMAVGDAAAHVNPCTGGGIPGAAKAGTWAAEAAIEAISDGNADEEAALWEYNRRVQTDFGKRFAAMDLYNIWGGTHDVDELTDIVAAMPGQQLADALALEGTASMSWPLKIKTAVKTFGHWGTLFELKQLNDLATELKGVYDQYPTSPDDFADWRTERDELMDDVYELTGAEPKY